MPVGRGETPTTLEGAMSCSEQLRGYQASSTFAFRQRRTQARGTKLVYERPTGRPAHRVQRIHAHEQNAAATRRFLAQYLLLCALSSTSSERPLESYCEAADLASASPPRFVFAMT